MKRDEPSAAHRNCAGCGAASTMENIVGWTFDQDTRQRWCPACADKRGAAFKTGPGCEMQRLCGDAGYCVGHCTAIASARATGDPVKVPREPTEAMIAAARHEESDLTEQAVRQIYRAMIEAAELSGFEDRQ